MAVKLNAQVLPHETIKHPKYDETLKSIREALQPPASPLIIVYGPPKVGKTRLKDDLAKELRSGVNPYISIPVVDVDLPFSGKKGGDFIDYHQKILAQLRDPFLSVDMPKCQQLDLFERTTPWVKKLDGRDLRELRKQSIRLLQAECCKAVLIDTRKPMGDVLGFAEFAEQVRFIQDLAFDSKVPHILFTNYDILRSEQLFAELQENSTLIHFSRYPIYNYAGFSEVVHNLLGAIAEQCDFDLAGAETQQFFYLYTLGRVGQLVQLVQGALKQAAQQGSTVLTMSNFEANAGYPAVLNKVRAYIEEGEERANCDDEAWKEAFSWVGNHIATKKEPPKPGNKGRRGSKKKPHDFKVA